MKLTAPRFALRFDIDTHRCLREGVPRLMRLADEEGVRFTFFVNMGRAVSRRAFLRQNARRSQGPAPTPRLSARKKLGLRAYAAAAVLNPRVGGSTPGIVRSALDAGHDVGLHGGTNHATWQTDAHRWSLDLLERELSFGLERFVEATGNNPVGFASPGWNGPKALPSLLAEQGFKYIADEHGSGFDLTWADAAQQLVSVPTHLTGEPDGVAYLEWGRARGLSTSDIVSEFCQTLDQKHGLLITYDHPYHAGIHEIETLRQMIRAARDREFEISTVKSIAEAFRSSS